MTIANKTTEIIGKIMEVFIGEDVTNPVLEEMVDHTFLYTY